MADKIVLDAQPRTVTGKQVNALRRQEIVPAIIYGPRLEQSVAIQAPRKPLQESLRQAGGTHLIEIHVGDQIHNTLVRDVQRNILTGGLLHVDFYAVALDVKIHAEVPLALVGVSPIVRSGDAILVTKVGTIEVECLPQNIPSELTLDISVLKAIGDQLTVADLVAPENVVILADPAEILVSTTYAAVQETAEEAAEAAEAAAAAETVEVIKRGKAEEEDF